MRSIICLPLGIIFLYASVFGKFEFTQVKITVKDNRFAVIEKNQLKAVNRSHKFYDLHLKFLQLPITNCKANYAFLKRSNGYKPYFLNYSLDVCKFLRHSDHVVNKFIYSFYKNYSNVNHTCPYNHDLIISRFPAYSPKVADFLPFPNGDYAIETRWYVDAKLRFEILIFFTYAN